MKRIRWITSLSYVSRRFPFVLLLLLGGLLVFILSFSSCAKLDSFLFNPDTLIGDYMLEKFSSEKIELPSVNKKYPDSTIDSIEQKTFSSGGNKLYAYYLKHNTSSSRHPVILYCHGNAGHMDFYWARIKLLYHSGAHVFDVRLRWLR